MGDSHGDIPVLTPFALADLAAVQPLWILVPHLWWDPHCPTVGADSCPLHQVGAGVLGEAVPAG